MLNKLLRRVGSSRSTQAKKAIIKPSNHSLDKRLVSYAALQTVDTLQKANFDAYIVGGGVRDLLLGDAPKDFDVATSATPEQITSLFRRSRIIGRRFKIVHVRYGREVIEVTTFRGNHKQGTLGDSKQCDSGVLLRDNVYGDMESDALRRDFTVNALYYDPSTEYIHDYTHGYRDIQSRRLEIIGDPDERYKEDPVRMLRAVRFSVKLGFTLSDESEAPILAHADYLKHIPPARLFEEVLKLFLSGYSAAILNKLKDYELLAHLLPTANDCLECGSEQYKKLIYAATANTDKRIRTQKRVTPAFIYAAMLWPALNEEISRLVLEQKFKPFDAMQNAAQGVISQQLAHTAIPKRFLIPMREIWNLQLRLPRRTGQRASQMLTHPRFRAAYDFLLLREESGEHMNGLGMWWTKYQSADESERQKMVDALPQGKSRRSRRRKPKPAAQEKE